MHRTALIEANEKFPYAQLVGGGPKLDNATLITGKADKKNLILECQNLDKIILHKVEITPL
jgi:hypothetical protein